MTKISRIIWNELVPSSPVFTTASVAQRAGIKLSNASRDLTNLQKHGMVARIRRGLWALTNHPDFSPYAVVPYLFAEGEGGYVSLLSALSLHGMMEQIPREVHLITTSQRPVLRTPVATYAFYRIEKTLFGGFRPYRRTGNFDIATPEKAVFDTLYFSARKGRRFSFLPEVELPAGFSLEELDGWIGKVSHGPLRTAVRHRWAELERRVAWAEEAKRRSQEIRSGKVKPIPVAEARARARAKLK